MIIILVVIDGYSINGYWWILMAISFVALRWLFYQWLLVDIGGYYICGYSINGYWLILVDIIFVVILSMVIS